MKEYITYIIKDYQHKLCPFEFNVKVLSQCKNLMLIKMHNVTQSNEETAKVERCNNFSKIDFVVLRMAGDQSSKQERYLCLML